MDTQAHYRPLIRLSYLAISAYAALGLAQFLPPQQTASLLPSYAALGTMLLCLIGLFQTKAGQQFCNNSYTDKFHAVLLSLATLCLGAALPDTQVQLFALISLSCLIAAALPLRFAALPFAAGAALIGLTFVDLFTTETTEFSIELDREARGLVLALFAASTVYLWKGRIANELSWKEGVKRLGKALLSISIFPAITLMGYLADSNSSNAAVFDALAGLLIIAGCGYLMVKREQLTLSWRWGIVLTFTIGLTLSLLSVGTTALTILFFVIPIAFVLLDRIDALIMSLVALTIPLSLGALSHYDFPFEATSHATLSGLTLLGVSLFLTGQIEGASKLFLQGVAREPAFQLRLIQSLLIGLVLFLIAMSPILDTFLLDPFMQENLQVFASAGVIALGLFVFLGLLVGQFSVQTDRQRELSTVQSETINQLKRAQERLDRVASGAQVTFWRVDRETGQITSNRLWRERWGYSNSDTVHVEQFWEKMGAEPAGFFQDLFERVYATATQVVVVRKASDKFDNAYHRITVIPEIDSSDNVIAVEVTNIDISAEMRAQEQLKAVNADLEKTLERQQQMFAVIGHELRTPVASIEMLIADDELTESQKLKNIEEISRNMLGVLEDLRVIVVPERAIEAKSERVSPQAVIQRTLGPLTGLVRKAGLSLHMELDPQACKCEFNAQALRRLLTNLVRNALLHSKGRNIWVKYKVNQAPEAYHQSATLIVEDDGKGIGAATEGKLFEAFYRGDSDADGTGLGLYICAELAQILGGSIDYKSRTEGGSTFIIKMKLPLHSEVETQTLTSSKMVNLNGMRVLIAEDEAMLRMLTTKQLNKVGAEVTACENGREALDAFETGEFDLILTDIMMPELNGYGLTKALRERNYTGPIVGITAAVVGKETDELKEAGADLVMSKPFRIGDFEKVLQTLANLPPRTAT